MTTKNMFITDPFNSPFVTGDESRPPDHLIGVVFAVIVLFVLPMLALNALVIDALLDTQSTLNGGLLLVLSVMLSINAILLGAGWWFWRRYSLRNNGKLIEGFVVKSEGETRPGPLGQEFVITVWYEFISPKTNKAITGTIAQTRDDLTADTLPEVGSSVAVLFLSDRNYRVM
jgi:hypothetical protein